MIYFKPLSQLDAHEAIQITKTLFCNWHFIPLNGNVHTSVGGVLFQDGCRAIKPARHWMWCLHTRGEKLSFSGKGKWVLQNAEHRTASVRGIEGPTQSLSPRMLLEFQLQLNNRVSLELSTGGGSVQALFTARRFQTVLLNSINSDTKNPPQTLKPDSELNPMYFFLIKYNLIVLLPEYQKISKWEIKNLHSKFTV